MHPPTSGTLAKPVPVPVPEDPMPSIPEDLLRHFFDQQIAFNRWLGMRLEAFGEGWARMVLPCRPELVGDPFRPAIHGGVLSALVDTTGGAAVFSLIGTEDRASTVDLRVDYLRPAGMETLVCEARVLRLGNRVAAVDATVHQGDPAKPVAIGRAVYNVRRVGE